MKLMMITIRTMVLVFLMASMMIVVKNCTSTIDITHLVVKLAFLSSQ